MVQTTNYPTKTNRDKGAAESGVHEGVHGSNTNFPRQDRQRQKGGKFRGVQGGAWFKFQPPSPTKTDRDSGVMVSAVGVTQRKNRAELGRTDSRERHKMRCQLAGEKIYS